MGKPNPKKPRILVVTCAYPSERNKARATFVHNWTKQLIYCGCDVQVLLREHITCGTYLSSITRSLNYHRSPTRFRYEWDGVRVEGFKVHFLLPLNYSWSAPEKTLRVVEPILERLRKEFKYDVIYLATWGDLSLAVSRFAVKTGIPYIACAIGRHDNDYYDKPQSLYYMFHREIYLNSEFVICVSEDLNRKIKIMTGGNAIIYTYYSGVNCDVFSRNSALRRSTRKQLGYSDEERVVLHVSRLERAKGVYELMAAFRELSAVHGNVRLLMIGEMFEKRQINRAIDKLGIRPQVTLIGGIAHRDVVAYMNAADVFVLASWMEGLPNVVLEAAACELPILASDVGGIPEFIENGITGILVKSRCAESLYNGLVSLMTSPARATAMGIAAHQKVLQEFNYYQNGSTLVKKLQDIVL